MLTDDGGAPFPPYLRDSGFVTVAGVPIAMRDAPFGTLAAFAREFAAFDEDDLNFLSAIANVLSEAVRRDRAEAELRRTALHDVVTGLPNRQLLDERLDQSLRFAERADLRVGVLFVDLDRFKVVNDSLGHDAGDEVLRAVATRLKSAVRASDTVARFGGDEFVIVAPGLVSDRDAVRLAQAVLQVLDAPISVGDRSIHMRASVGITVGDPKAQRTPRALLRDADVAMYRAKPRPGNSFELHDPAAAEVIDALQVEQGLRDALAGGELRLAFQPFVDLDASSTFGAEVLLRWQHPTKGLVGPGYFLDVAEQSGLIVPIREWMLREACSLAARWHKRSDFLLTINLSATQLAERGIIEAVRGALESTGMRPECLGLELIEQVLIGDEEATFATLADLKAVGVKLLLDDFGTG